MKKNYIYRDRLVLYSICSKYYDDFDYKSEVYRPKWPIIKELIRFRSFFLANDGLKTIEFSVKDNFLRRDLELLPIKFSVWTITPLIRLIVIRCEDFQVFPIQLCSPVYMSNRISNNTSNKLGIIYKTCWSTNYAAIMMWSMINCTCLSWTYPRMYERLNQIFPSNHFYLIDGKGTGVVHCKHYLK